MPPEIYGPLGLLVALLIAVGVLWRDHKQNDTKRDALLDVAMSGWTEQTASSKQAAAEITEVLKLVRGQRRGGSS